MPRTRTTATLEKRINEHTVSIAQSISDGACQDYAGYRYQCGYLKAMHDVIAILDQLEQEG